jgi:hypothetical protein
MELDKVLVIPHMIQEVLDFKNSLLLAYGKVSED